MKEYIRLLRPKHWIKNVLVLLPLTFSGRLLEPAALGRAMCAFAAFCALASMIYIINDVRDADLDRQHPAKRSRPVAGGTVAVPRALALAAALAAAVVGLGLWGRFPPEGWLCLGGYFALNLGYSFGLKNVPILDIAILASGFLLRMLLGAAVTGIAISGWLYLTVTSASFYFGLGKRRSELLLPPEDARQVLRYYSGAFLERYMQLCLTLAIVFYSLWSMDAGAGGLMWTAPLAICICMRYGMAMERSADGDPVEVLYQDRVLATMAAVFAAVTLGLLYL